MSRFVALLWAGAVLGGAQDATTSEELPAIRAVQGDLHVWSSSKDKLTPVTEPVRVTPLDRIGTRKDKYAVLATQDGSLISLSEVEVGREKGLALERTKDKLVIKLYKGKIAVETFLTGLRVETPNGVLEGGPSSCLVEVDGKKTHIMTVDRPMTFLNSLGTVKLEAGQESTAERTTKPSDPKAADVEKAMGEATAQTAALNLVKNPGFEEGLKEWGREQMSGKESTTVENALKHNGRSCARLEVNDRVLVGTNPGWLGFKQNLSPTPGKRYLYRAYVRLELRSGSVKPYLSIEALGGPKWFMDPAEKGWARVGGVYTAEARSHRVSIEALIESEKFDAVIWVDDFLLLELK